MEASSGWVQELGLETGRVAFGKRSSREVELWNGYWALSFIPTKVLPSC